MFFYTTFNLEVHLDQEFYKHIHLEPILKSSLFDGTPRLMWYMFNDQILFANTKV